MSREIGRRELASTEAFSTRHFENLDYVKRTFHGVQMYFKFPNGYELSVVSHGGSYGAGDGLYEVMPFYTDEKITELREAVDPKGTFEERNKQRSAVMQEIRKYTSPFLNEFGSRGDDVIGWVKPETLEEMLDWMEAQE